MSRRIGSNYRVLVSPETTYGVAASGSFTELPDTLNFSETTNAIEVSAKTGTLKKQHYQTLEGTSVAAVTLNGNFSVSHSVALDAAMFDTASPRVLQQSQSAAYSYTVYRVYTDDGKLDYVTGCTADSLTINGSSGEVVQYNLSMRGKTIAREQDSGSISGLTISSCAPSIEPFLFSNATGTLVSGSTTAFNSFELSLTNEFQGDPEIYQNSTTKNLEVLTGIDATLKYNWNYDSANDSDVYDKLLDSTLQNASIALVSTAGTFTIDSYGKYTEYNSPDPDNGIFVSDATMAIRSDCENTIEGLTITTT